jgi:hypothetical protein
MAVDVSVQVDESGRDVETVGVNDLGRRRRVDLLVDRCDSTAAYRDVAGCVDPGCRVDDVTTANEQIESDGASLRSGRQGRQPYLTGGER